MLIEKILNLELILSVLIPLALVYVVYVFINRIWRKFTKQRNEQLIYKAETFRNPINLSVTVTGLIIPLISVLLAYLMKSEFLKQIEQLSGLFASLFILSVSMFWGLWLSYSLATASPNDDSFKITKTKNWKLPASFASQLFLLIIGILLLIWFLLFRLEFNTSLKHNNLSEQHEVFRKRISIGSGEIELRKNWGEPHSINPSEKGRVKKYVYHYPDSIYTFTFKDGKLVSFQEEMATDKGGNG